MKQQVSENEKLAQAFKECQQDVTKTVSDECEIFRFCTCNVLVCLHWNTAVCGLKQYHNPLQLDQLNSCQEEQKKKEQLLAQREAALKRKAEAYLEMESKLNSKERVIQQNFKAFTKV